MTSNRKHPKSMGLDQGTNTPLWDPVGTVKCIMMDAANANSDKSSSNNNGGSVAKGIIASQPPGSRFISRILPLQATVSESPV